MTEITPGTSSSAPQFVEQTNIDREKSDEDDGTVTDGGGWTTIALANVTKDHIHTVVNDGPGNLEVGLGQDLDQFTLQPGESKDFRHKGALHLQAETGSGDAAYRYICEGN